MSWRSIFLGLSLGLLDSFLGHHRELIPRIGRASQREYPYY
jgi:hypothetical protein